MIVSAVSDIQATFDGGARPIGAGIKRLAGAYVWVTIATGAIVFTEPAPYDALMMGAVLTLPLVGLTRFTRGVGFNFLLWMGIVGAGFIATAQAGVFDVAATHMAVTLYLALSSVVMAAFVLDRPEANVRLIMSAYLLAALIAACAGLIGYFQLMPGAADLFATDFGRARGTFKDPNVLGAFLVPALLYVLHLVLRTGVVRAGFWLLATPILLFGSLLAFSRGAWLNLGVSVLAYAYFAFATAASHRQRLKLMIYALADGVLAAGLLMSALSIPTVSELIGERATLEQPYDVEPEGGFAGQRKAIDLVVEHPLGIGALEFGRLHHHEDVHELYLSMFLNGGWVGGTLYLAMVLLTLWLGLQQVVRDRGGNSMAAFWSPRLSAWPSRAS